MHVNVSHFQDSSLFGFKAHHRAALELAANGNVLSALVVNAWADHYLQDQFAPGHVITPRMGLHDATSGSLHNHYNARGLDLKVRNADLLLALLALDRLEPQLRQQLLYLGCSKESVSACLPETIRMRGDGRLGKNAQQELFLTLLIARSVADVFSAFVTARPESSFGPFRWYAPDYDEKGTWRTRDDAWTTPASEANFWSYARETRRGSLPFNRFWVVSIAAARQDFTSSSGNQVLVRASLPVYVQPAGWRYPNRKDRAETDLFVGADLATGGRRTGLGVHYLMLVPITRGVQWNLDLGYRTFFAGRNRWRGSHIGAHIGWGYGLLFATGGVARMPYLGQDNRVRNPWGYAATVSAFLPPVW